MRFPLQTILFLLISALAAAQNGTIQGLVVDAKTSEPIIVANVVIQGTTVGAATDLDGKFQINNVKPGSYALVVSFVTYTQTLTEVTVESGKVKVQLEAQNLETKNEAGAAGARLDGQTFVVICSASDAGALYGSVTGRDAAEAADAAGFTFKRDQVVLDRPIKDLGLHTVSVVLHPEVTVKIRLNVARSVEEAALQASCKSIQELAAEAEAAAEFEIAELFDEVGAAASDE